VTGPDAEQIAGNFRKVLDAHGFSFQYAVLKAAEAFSNLGTSPWVFEVSEFPIGSVAKSTRIDFVLRHSQTGAYLIAECKRANPAISRWCFAKAPLRGRGLAHSRLMWERVRRWRDELRSEGYGTHYVDNAYDIGLELKGSEPGEQSAGARGAIEAALTQVLTGVNGFAEFLASRPGLLQADTASLLIPVIFTTATLYVSDVELSSADILTGKLRGDPNVRETPWLIYQYHQSPGLAHNVPGNPVTKNLSSALEVDLTRSVAVVSPGGIESFLQWSPEG